jgi:hypothetical protein
MSIEHLPDGSARLDMGRSGRIGLPEAVYCSGKTTEQCVAIVDTMLSTGTDAVLATRCTDDQRRALTERLSPDAEGGRSLLWRPRRPTGRTVGIISAGTSDLPVAEECRLALLGLGHTTELITDVGVAGLQRLTAALPAIEVFDAIVAIAGMEGALPTVLAGLVHQPIVAVPTSVGYGSAFEGVTALLSMMSSCAPGIAVVGIDNGYGAACAIHRVLRVAP